MTTLRIPTVDATAPAIVPRRYSAATRWLAAFVALLGLVLLLDALLMPIASMAEFVFFTSPWLRSGQAALGTLLTILAIGSLRTSR